MAIGLTFYINGTLLEREEGGKEAAQSPKPNGVIARLMPWPKQSHVPVKAVKANLPQGTQRGRLKAAPQG
jgi:hypothetical protein